MLCGVPQGSILGPKLFVLYVNDICNISKVLKFILFVDDTNIFCSGHDEVQLNKDVSKELDKLSTWFVVNKLSLNLSKTNFMLFCNSKQRNTTIKVSINKKEINRVFVTKFLGILIDDKLNWKEHINLVCSKLSICIAVMYKAKQLLDKNSLVILYCSLFVPCKHIAVKFGEILIVFTYCKRKW